MGERKTSESLPPSLALTCAARTVFDLGEALPEGLELARHLVHVESGVDHAQVIVERAHHHAHLLRHRQQSLAHRIDAVAHQLAREIGHAQQKVLDGYGHREVVGGGGGGRMGRRRLL